MRAVHTMKTKKICLFCCLLAIFLALPYFSTYSALAESDSIPKGQSDSLAATAPEPTAEATPEPPAEPSEIATQNPPAETESQPTPVPQTPSPKPKPTVNPEKDQKALAISGLISPDALVSPGNVSIQITLKNTASQPITQIKLFNPAGKQVLGPETLGAKSDSKRFDETYNVSAEQLSSGSLTYTVSYVLGNDEATQRTVKKSLTLKISKVDAKPKIEFARNISSRFVPSGTTVTVTYRLRNTGNVPLINLKVSDSMAGTVGSLSKLGVGEKKTFTKKIRVEKDIASKATVNFSYDGSTESLSKSLSKASISIAKEDLNLVLSTNRTTALPGDVVNLTLKLTNNGNVSYSRLRVCDAILGDLGSIPGELKPGQEYIFNKQVPIKSTTQFLFSISGRSSSGKEINQEANPLTVLVASSENITDRLTLKVTPNQTRLDTPGIVNFTVSLFNNSGHDLKDVLLFEQSHGVIKNMTVISAGETQIEQSYEVTAGSIFQFVAQVTDQSGNTLTAFSEPISIEIVNAGATPATTDDSDLPIYATDSPAGYKLPANPQTFRKMMSLIIIFLVLIILIVILSITGRKFFKKLRPRTKDDNMDDTMIEEPLRRSARNKKQKRRKSKWWRRPPKNTRNHTVRLKQSNTKKTKINSQKLKSDTVRLRMDTGRRSLENDRAKSDTRNNHKI